MYRSIILQNGHNSEKDCQQDFVNTNPYIVKLDFNTNTKFTAKSKPKIKYLSWTNKKGNK